MDEAPNRAPDSSAIVVLERCGLVENSALGEGDGDGHNLGFVKKSESSHITANSMSWPCFSEAQVCQFYLQLQAIAVKGWVAR